MKIEIYKDNELVDLTQIYLKSTFNDQLINKINTLTDLNMDFSSIGLLKGDKNILQLAFQSVLKDSLN
jgi:hypothetical protein